MLRSKSNVALSVESLESREVPAVTAVFNPGFGTLAVFGDGADNTIEISRDSLGVISVNGQVPLAGGLPGGFPTVFNTKSISVFGLGGNDSIRLDETNGPLPGAQLFGGSGNDSLTGGSGVDALHGQDGNDLLTGGAGADFLLGQSGADVMFGGDGADQMFGGSGDDTADGDRGDDVAFLGDDNDLFVWDPGDGSDRVEGEIGFDTMLFNGSGADELFEASANGQRLRFTRNVGNIVMDTDGVERVDVEALGGADTITLNDLTGTAVQELRIDLEAVKNGGAADDRTDRVILNGTAGQDIVSVLASGGNLFALGLPTFVTVQRAAAADQLTVNTLGGNDRVEAGSIAAGVIFFTADGGAGSDTLFGTNDADVLIGGVGNDFVDGGRGNDAIGLGEGDDTFVAETGDGVDLIEGGAGFDGVRVSGSSANETAAMSANGERLRFTLNTSNVILDANNVEFSSFLSFGGADTVVVNDLSGTDVDLVDISLFDFGVPGGNADVVVVNGTAGNDAVTAESANGVVTVNGLAARVRITGTEAAGDRLEVAGLGGDDSIDATGLEAAEMRFLADGGAGDDVLLGGAGDDVLLGGDGADVLFAGSGDNVAFGGAGDDVLRGEEGDDVLDGGAGDDVLLGGAGDDVLLNGEVVFDE
ncbi:MAG TPA: calcium-binding protein [Fimbriiglobus sp.]|jgi:Ca2+-binding RTX toxin-like protein|nr:calcium-binding protein [Fimbriiglobus sp.]